MKRMFLIVGMALALAACNAQNRTVTGTENASSTSGAMLDTNSSAVMTLPSIDDSTLEWWAKNTGSDTNGVPQNTLTLRTAGNGQSLYQSQCVGTTLVTGVQDMQGAAAYIQCWWAGGGDQFAVFNVDGKNIVRHRTVDEQAGYGKWEDLKTL